MIAIHIRKRFIHLFPTNSSFLCKSNVSFSLALHFFSTSVKRKREPTIPTVSESLLHKHQLPPGVASIVNQLKNPEKCDSVLTFLKEAGFSTIQLEKIVKSRPQVLSAKLDNSIKPKITIFQDLGLSPYEIAKIISKEPTILCCSMSNRVIPSLSVLKGLLGSNVEVAKVLKTSGWFLIRDLEKTMVPNVEFLMSLGIPLGNILYLLYTYPRCLLHKPETLRKRLEEKIDKMGSNRSSKLFIHAVRVVVSVTDEKWELKLQVFRDLGFSESNILAMFRKAPQMFATSSEKLKRIHEILLATGKYNMSSIVNYPMAFTGSVKNRYIPRLQVLGILEENNLIKNWPCLATLYLMPDEKFYKKFVAPYLDAVGHVDITKGVVGSERESKLITST